MLEGDEETVTIIMNKEDIVRIMKQIIDTGLQNGKLRYYHRRPNPFQRFPLSQF